MCNSCNSAVAHYASYYCICYGVGSALIETGRLVSKRVDLYRNGSTCIEMGQLVSKRVDLYRYRSFSTTAGRNIHDVVCGLFALSSERRGT